jgi:hypothetical protein
VVVIDQGVSTTSCSSAYPHLAQPIRSHAGFRSTEAVADRPMDKGFARSMARKPAPVLAPSTVSLCTKNKGTPSPSPSRATPKEPGSRSNFRSAREAGPISGGDGKERGVAPRLPHQPEIRREEL